MFGLSGIKLAIAAGVVILVVVLGATCAVLWSRLDAKDAEIASLADQLQVAAGDARRWEDHAGQQQAVIDSQAAEIRRLEADAVSDARIAAAKEERAQARTSALQMENSQLKEKARAHPEDVRELGPIVRGALGGLRD